MSGVGCPMIGVTLCFLGLLFVLHIFFDCMCSLMLKIIFRAPAFVKVAGSLALQIAVLRMPRNSGIARGIVSRRGGNDATTVGGGLRVDSCYD